MTWIDEKTELRVEINEAALDLYRRMREIQCTCEPRPDSMAYYDVPDECDGCVEWALLNRELARLVQLPLYEVHVVPPPSGECFLQGPEESRRAAFSSTRRALVLSFTGFDAVSWRRRFFFTIKCGFELAGWNAVNVAII